MPSVAEGTPDCCSGEYSPARSGSRLAGVGQSRPAGVGASRLAGSGLGRPAGFEQRRPAGFEQRRPAGVGVSTLVVAAACIEDKQIQLSF